MSKKNILCIVRFVISFIVLVVLQEIYDIGLLGVILVVAVAVTWFVCGFIEGIDSK